MKQPSMPNNLKQITNIRKRSVIVAFLKFRKLIEKHVNLFKFLNISSYLMY